MIIAIDGPSAAGKGTLARRLAARMNFAFLDTGSLYRATAAKLLDMKAPLDDEAEAAKVARNLTAVDRSRDDLRREEVGEAASRVAALPAVRAALLELQREFAHHPPAPARGAVLDGRDIGTVICPDATLKLFVTARPEVRADRRHRELLSAGVNSIFDNVLADVRMRDERDSGRSAAPLKPAEDAHILDTSDLDADAVLEAAMALVERVRARG